MRYFGKNELRRVDTAHSAPVSLRSPRGQQRWHATGRRIGGRHRLTRTRAPGRRAGEQRAVRERLWRVESPGSSQIGTPGGIYRSECGGPGTRGLSLPGSSAGAPRRERRTFYAMLRASCAASSSTSAQTQRPKARLGRHSRHPDGNDPEASHPRQKSRRSTLHFSNCPGSIHALTRSSRCDISPACP